MAKVSRTKTHVKIYLTPIEVDAFTDMMSEAATGLRHDSWSPAMDRVDDTVGPARRLAKEIREQS